MSGDRRKGGAAAGGVAAALKRLPAAAPPDLTAAEIERTQSAKMKGIFKSKPRTPADIVLQTRDLLVYVDRTPISGDPKLEEKVL